jgi:hypothetical protein
MINPVPSLPNVAQEKAMTGVSSRPGVSRGERGTGSRPGEGGGSSQSERRSLQSADNLMDSRSAVLDRGPGPGRSRQNVSTNRPSSSIQDQSSPRLLFASKRMGWHSRTVFLLTTPTHLPPSLQSIWTIRPFVTPLLSSNRNHTCPEGE